ncbi:Cro/Cl family transcriptional regulator [Chromobacterium sinusclupearum]|uniref:Cro/Cl family transcriptional regulator n=1 Tax=Chromobacterium sinusclupearum TaxID=2077146 RepID=A0A2K4MM08_9NEIS|nr:helix-turn-helix transcriptional regulator [Chromobacterium sinusclupearum]POA98113.1 Cro/Cl family transcriptional regulator [Chromobacterium sinusclupearum]
MPIKINLDVLLVQRKVKSKDLAHAIGITEQNLSLLKQGKIKGFRFSTLEAICRHLNCQPGDLLQYIPPAPGEEGASDEEAGF